MWKTRWKTLDIGGKIEIGLKLFKLVLSPFLYTGVTFEVLNASGTMPVSKDLLM